MKSLGAMVKQLTAFGTNWNKTLKRDCVRSHCRACDVDKARQYRKTPAGIASRTREHRRQFRRSYTFFKDIKTRLRCCACGEADPCCIDFHHVNGAEKRFALSAAIRSSIKRLIAELRKCVCVCANCHRKLHAKRLFLTRQAKTIGSTEIAAALEARITAKFDDGGEHNERLMRRRNEIAT